MITVQSMRLFRCLLGAWMLLTGASAAAECTLKVGWEPWEPYSYRDAEGQLVGLDVALVRAMAQGAGCEISFVQMPWGRLLEELRHGNSVQVISGASRTPEREAYAWFSVPYRNETMELFIRREDLDEHSFTTFEEMIDSGFHLGVTRNYYYGKAFAQAMENPRFEQLAQEVTTDLQNIWKLEAGRIDGFLADRFVAAHLIREHGPTGWIQAHPMYVNSSGIHLMFSKRAVQPEIVQRFDAALEELKDSGDHDRILADYSNK